MRYPGRWYLIRVCTVCLNRSSGTDILHNLEIVTGESSIYTFSCITTISVSHRIEAIVNINISTNVDQKSLETEFSIAICRHAGDKWQSKTLCLASFDPRSSIVKSVFDCRLSGVSIASWTYNLLLY